MFPTFFRSIQPGRFARAILPCCCILASQIGCSPEAGSPIVAQVAGHEITPTELRAFGARLPDGIHEGRSDAQANEMVLDALIDKKLLLAEAEAQRLPDDPGFALELTAFRDQEMMKLYNRLEVDRHISISEEELHEQYQAGAWNRALRLSAILVETMEKAEELKAELDGGKPFRQLVDKYSVDATTRSWGGDTGRYLTKNSADESLRTLFALSAGDISEPLPFGYKGRKHFAVFRVLDEMPIDLNDVREEVEEEVFGARRAARRVALTDSLTRVYQPEVHADGAGFIAARAAEGRIELSEKEAARPLGSYRDGTLEAGTYLSSVLHKAGPGTRRQLTDSTWVAASVGSMLTTRMLMAEALAMGLDQDSTVVKLVENERENLLVSLLRKINVDNYISVDEEEAHAFYDDNPEKFRYSEATIVAEVLLNSAEEAEKVKEQLEAGADVEQLIEAHDTRGVHSENMGYMRLDRYRRVHYPHIYDIATGLDVGQVGGPIKVPEGYSVFVVTEQQEARPKPYNAASVKRATAYVRIDKAKRGYVEYVRDLRAKYQVEVFPANLPAMVVDGKFQADG